MLHTKLIVWNSVPNVSVSKKFPDHHTPWHTFKAVCSHEKKCCILWWHFYKEPLNRKEISFSAWSEAATYCSLLQASHCALRGRVKSACSLELRNVYNKLRTLTTLDLNWFQMLQQSVEKRTAGSPSTTTVIFKKVICKKKMTLRLWEFTKLYG